MDKGQANYAVFVIQARMGSVRLPGKILMPAFAGKSILDIITAKLRTRFPHIPVYVASGPQAQNAALESWAAGKDLQLVWGSENDVWSRFRDIARSSGASYLIRICADNPFLDMDYVDELLQEACRNPEAEYIAHCVNGTPSIRTHLGIYCEMIAGQALLHKMEGISAEDREHVTSFIYGAGKEHFRLAWIKHQWPAEIMDCLRLSVDTPEDMENAASLYALTEGNAKRAAEYVSEHPEIAARMAKQIQKFKK